MLTDREIKLILMERKHQEKKRQRDFEVYLFSILTMLLLFIITAYEFIKHIRLLV